MCALVQHAVLDYLTRVGVALDCVVATIVLTLMSPFFLYLVSLAMVMALVTWYLLLYIIVREASENHTALPKVLCCTGPSSSI